MNVGWTYVNRIFCSLEAAGSSHALEATGEASRIPAEEIHGSSENLLTTNYVQITKKPDCEKIFADSKVKK